MVTLFDCAAPFVNAHPFGLGLAHPQQNNLLPTHPADSASIEEERARSIRLTIEREAGERREATLERIAAREEARRWEELAELEELASRFDSVCHA